jgi:hypothetical protein
MHKYVGKLIFKEIMLRNLIFFMCEIKSYASKQKVISTIFEKKKRLQPLYFWQM